MDPLSDVLRAVRLDGAYFFHVEAGAPWSATAGPASEVAPQILPNAENVMPYHILLSGSCYGGPIGGPQVRMGPGDVILFPHGDAHLMSSSEGKRFGKDDSTPGRYPGTVMLGPDQARDTTLVCGFLGCDVRPFNPLLASLPSCLHVPGIGDGWLSQFPRQVVSESRLGRAGSETMLTRMAELMFVEVIRQHIETLPEEQSGWLAGLRDPLVSKALAQLHEQPTKEWTLHTLARSIDSSRSVLAERFASVVGMTPMLYLTRWRLQLASEELRQGSSSVAQVAARVGYSSEAAFSKAFKRETGISPGAWRKT